MLGSTISSDSSFWWNRIAPDKAAPTYPFRQEAFMLSAPLEYPPSRPGIRTLLIAIAMVVVFFIVKFWTELQAVVGV
jgi:hypothetical protein